MPHLPEESVPRHQAAINDEPQSSLRMLQEALCHTDVAAIALEPNMTRIRKPLSETIDVGNLCMYTYICMLI